jgi:quinol-cytochrome oxidoreductase complex cytochrome b subunit
MYGFHIFVLPLVVAGLIGIHLTMVRLRGVVKPYPLEDQSPEVAS